MAVPNILNSFLKPFDDPSVNNVEDFFSRVIVLVITFFFIYIPSFALDTENPDQGFWSIKIPTQRIQITPICVGAGLAVLGIFTNL